MTRALTRTTAQGATEPMDEELVAAARGGSQPAFAVVVERYQEMVFSLARAMTGNDVQSEEIAQETFVLAWTRLSSMREPARLRAWLCGIARLVSQRARFERTRQVPLGVVPAAANVVSAEPSPLEKVISDEEEQVVLAALAEVPEIHRIPLLLFYREHQSVGEIAEALGTSEKSIKTRLWRGRNLLKANIAALLASGLSRSRPPAAFVATVLAAIATARLNPPRARGAARWLALAGAAVVGLPVILGPRWMGAPRLPAKAVVAAAAAPSLAAPGSKGTDIASFLPAPGAVPPAALQERPPGVRRVVLDLDFEDGKVPGIGTIGDTTSGIPRSGNRYSYRAELKPLASGTYLSVGLGDGSRDGKLFSYSNGLVLAFDYWLAKERTLIIKVASAVPGEAESTRSHRIHLDATRAGQWAHVEVPLRDHGPADDGARIEEGDRITNLYIIARYETGQALEVDNIQVFEP